MIIVIAKQFINNNPIIFSSIRQCILVASNSISVRRPVKNIQRNLSTKLALT
jgi:hypothetical protein